MNLQTKADHPNPPNPDSPFSETQFRQELAHCLHTLGEQEPTIFGKTAQDTQQTDRLQTDRFQTDRIQQSEHSRTFLWLSLPSGNNSTEKIQTEKIQTVSPDRWLLRVIYDRLVLTPHTAEILDWKTYPQPPDLHRIIQHWQTRLTSLSLGKPAPTPPNNSP